MSEKRQRTRNSTTGKVGLVWIDEAGHHLRESGTWSDLSESGGSLLLNRPILRGTTVRLNSPLLCESATAIVRECLPKGMGYRLGLESTSGGKWRRDAPGLSDAG